VTREIVAQSPRGDAPYTFAAARADEVTAAARSLRERQSTWATLSVAERLNELERFAQGLNKQRAALQAALEADTGRRLLAGIEIDGCIGRINYWAKHAPAILEVSSAGVSESAPSVRYEHQFQPYNLVGVISPWNFPLLLTLTDALPALAAGCAVLAKPSEITPRFVEPLAEVVASVPELAAVFKLLQGDGLTGQALVDSVDVVCFTGSVATGRKVGAQAGGRVIPAFLELGGKDPLVVLAGADLDSAAATALRASCISTGQACQSIERVYVHESHYDSFVARLVESASRIRPNLERIDEGHIGPFIDARQAETVQRHVDDAVAQGAVQHCGGVIRGDDGGVWCAPIVLTGVTHNMQVMQEETFGPVVPVMPFADEAEAVHLANDTTFGLSAAVLGPEDAALRVARQINAGAVSVGDAGLTTQVSDVEKDSFALSGVGRSRMGATGLRRFLRSKALLVQTTPPLPIDVFEEQPQGEPS